MRLFKSYLVLLAILELGLGLLAYNYRAATSASIMTICASVALTMIFGAFIFTATLWVCMVLDPDLR
jgi:uncharacterized membrane protein YesL